MRLPYYKAREDGMMFTPTLSQSHCIQNPLGVLQDSILQRHRPDYLAVGAGRFRGSVFVISGSQSQSRPSATRNSSSGCLRQHLVPEQLLSRAAPPGALRYNKYRHNSTSTPHFALVGIVLASIAVFISAPANATEPSDTTNHSAHHPQKRRVWRRELHQLESEHAHQD